MPYQDIGSSGCHRRLVLGGTGSHGRFSHGPVQYFGIAGAALRFGESILRWLKNPIVQGFLIALVILCTVGSVVSVYGWIRRSKTSRAVTERKERHGREHEAR